MQISVSFAASAEGGAAGLACARSRRSVWARGGGGAGAGAVGIGGRRWWRAAAALALGLQKVPLPSQQVLGVESAIFPRAIRVDHCDTVGERQHRAL